MSLHLGDRAAWGGHVPVCLCVHVGALELHGGEGEWLVCSILRGFSRCKGWEVANVTTLFVCLGVTVC